MDQQLSDLFHRFVGQSFDRQLRFREFLKRKDAGKKPKFDVETATLVYGPKLQFTAPLAGTHIAPNNTWTWAWANRVIKLSLTNRALGDTIRALAHRAMAPEFAKPAFPLEPLLGPEMAPHAADFFGKILIGELDYDAYVIVRTSAGRDLLLIRDDRLRTIEKHPLSRVLSVFPQMLRAIPAPDARSAFIAFARSFGLSIEEAADVVSVKGHGKGELKATFHALGHLLKIAGTGLSAPKPRPRPAVRKKAASAGKKPIPAAKKKKTPKVKSKRKQG